LSNTLLPLLSKSRKRKSQLKRIKEAEKPVKKKQKIDRFFERFLPKTYRKDSSYIEKTAHRIDTPGEIKGITAKGWVAKRRKSWLKKIVKPKRRDKKMAKRKKRKIRKRKKKRR